MKPNITLACKKSPCFPPVKTKETKKEIKQKALKDKSDDDQNSYR